LNFAAIYIGVVALFALLTVIRWLYQLSRILGGALRATKAETGSNGFGTKMRKRKAKSEESEQVALVSWFRLAYPRYKYLLFHVPNGAATVARGAKLKKLGVVAGVPDLLLCVTSKKYPGLFIELKKERTGVVSEVQARMHKRLKKQGYKVAVCWGFDEAKKTIEDYLK